MKLQKTKLAAAIAVTGALLVPIQQAQAEVVASAVIEFTDFQIWGSYGSGGDTVIRQLDVSDFLQLDFASTADADASLGAQTDSITNAIDSLNNGIDFPTKTPSGTVFSPLGNDLCIGDCSGAVVNPGTNDNAFQQITEADVAATGDYAWADQLEAGSPITGQTNRGWRSCYNKCGRG